MTSNPHPLSPRRATVILSALLLWCAGALSMLAGATPVAIDIGHPASNAARAADMPAQHSTPAVRFLRQALLTDRSAEQDFGTAHHDGADTAILPGTFRLLHPLRGNAPSTAEPTGALVARTAGFHARAPPILS